MLSNIKLLHALVTESYKNKSQQSQRGVRCVMVLCKWLHCSPPPVDPDVGRAREPGVEDVDAADSIRSQQRFLERRVVVEPQALPEPVDRINDHYSTGRVLLFLFELLAVFRWSLPLLVVLSV